MKNLPPLAFVDIETTGSSAVSDRIIEIGILRVEGDTMTGSMKQLINPHTYVPPFILEMTGIRSADLKNAPSFRDVMQEVYEMLEGCIFVAHNARFDYGFIKNEFKRYDYTFSAKVLDTVKLSRLLFPQHSRHNLDTIINRFNIACESRHRAFDDAKVLWDFFRTLRTDHPHLPIDETIDRLIKQPSLPPQLKHLSLPDIPETPGVYLFYGDTELPLYIGKSTSLRNRVLSHFSGDHTSQTEMMISQQVQHIETIQTAGELGALILEARLIKEKKPFYNRRLRSIEQLTIVKETMDKDGYRSVKIEEVATIEPADLPSILHICGSKKKARAILNGIAEKHGLCPVRLGIESSISSCFNYKIGKCNGACVGEEGAALYNAKFALAFAETKITPWPFEGPVVIRETNAERETTEFFLFDQWCYLASISEQDIAELTDTRFEYSFDLDSYKILKRFLSKKPINTFLETIPLSSLPQFLDQQDL